MRNLATLLMFLLVMVLALPAIAVAADVGEAMSPAEVVEITRARDGDTIVVEGEAVGDALRAIGGGTWVNVLGDEVGLGVWMTDEMAGQIEHFGAYHRDGDVVRVTGTLNITCAEHGGEFDLHAQSLEVLEQGKYREHEPRFEYALVGLAGLVIGTGLLVRYRTLSD